MAEFNLINRAENMVDYLLTITDKAPKNFAQILFQNFVEQVSSVFKQSLKLTIVHLIKLNFIISNLENNINLKLRVFFKQLVLILKFV